MPVTGPMQTGNFKNNFDKNFKKIFFDEYTRFPAQYSKIAKSVNADGHFWQEGRMIGLGSMETKPEGRSFNYEAFKQGADKTAYFTSYGKGVQITQEMLDDDMTGHMKKAMGELGKSAAYTKELHFWDLLNTGFSGGKVGVDGKQLFAADHPIEDGIALNNLATGALSYAALQNAIGLFDEQKNDRNIPIVDSPYLLIVGPKLRWKAEELLKSELKPDTDLNNINTLRGEGLQYMVCNYLTSDTSWFLVSKNHDLRFMWRKNLAFESKDDFNTGNRLYKATMRHTTDFWDWRGIVGSTGV